MARVSFILRKKKETKAKRKEKRNKRKVCQGEREISTFFSLQIATMSKFKHKREEIFTCVNRDQVGMATYPNIHF